MKQYVTFTREQLYELAWQKPAVRIAEEFGISDVGLAKICARHGIPKPPRGYWAKSEDTRPPRTTLPVAKNPRPIQLPVMVPEGSDAQELASQAAAEKRAGERIVVADRLRKPCELIQAVRAALQDADTDEIGFLEAPPSTLDLHVSRDQLSRTLRIADALIKAFQERGWETVIHDGRTLVDVDGIAIGVRIEEKTETVEQPIKPDLESGYSFHYNRFDTVRRPSGCLSVMIREEDRIWHTQQRNWNDSKKREVEDRLHLVIVGMLRLAAAVKSHQIQQEKETRERQDQERRREVARQEQARLRDELRQEKGRVEFLLKQAERWRVSQNLRLFIAEVQEQGKLAELNIEGQEVETWATWALQQADRLDPFAVSPPSILDDEKQILHMCAHLGVK